MVKVEFMGLFCRYRHFSVEVLRDSDMERKTDRVMVRLDPWRWQYSAIYGAMCNSKFFSHLSWDYLISSVPYAAHWPD